MFEFCLVFTLLVAGRSFADGPVPRAGTTTGTVVEELTLRSRLTAVAWDEHTLSTFRDMDVVTFGEALELIYKSKGFIADCGLRAASYQRLAQLLSQMGHPVRNSIAPRMVENEIEANAALSPATKAALENAGLVTYAKLREVTAAQLRHAYGFPFSRIEELARALRSRRVRLYTDAIDRAQRTRRSLPASTELSELAISSALLATLREFGATTVRDLRPDLAERLDLGSTPELVRQYGVLHASVREAVDCGDNLWF